MVRSERAPGGDRRERVGQGDGDDGIGRGVVDWQPGESRSAERLYYGVGERQRVRRVLSQMKSRSAKILVLRHTGLSYAEIAAAIRVSPNSVGKLLSRAEKEFEDLWGAER